jgi:hypothetical protein
MSSMAKINKSSNIKASTEKTRLFIYGKIEIHKEVNVSVCE